MYQVHRVAEIAQIYQKLIGKKKRRPCSRPADYDKDYETAENPEPSSSYREEVKTLPCVLFGQKALWINGNGSD